MDAPDHYQTKYDSKTKIVVFYSLSHNHIRIHQEKCIQISTNIPGIGWVVFQIAFEIRGFVKKIHDLLRGKLIIMAAR